MVRINSKDYLLIDLIEVNQKGKLFYVGKINARDLLKIYTVRPAKYDIEKNSSFAKSFPNDREYYNHLINENKTSVTEKDFQRKYSDGRVNEIRDFLNKEEYPFFPNTIIANCDLINDLDAYDIDSQSGIQDFERLTGVPDHLAFFSNENGQIKLLIPYLSDSLLIIDGQHRLEGLKKSDDSVKNNYELLVAFIIGYDRSVVAQQFYTINYEQKPVNKSLLYHLMGEFSTNLDELTFVHKVVKALNEIEYSPFYKRIKMLGVTPSDVPKDERYKLSISLAFLIDSLIRSISKNVSSGVYQPIFRYYYEHEDYQIDIIRFLINYFDAVKDLVEDWDEPSRSLISKGMGIGALIKVLQLIFPIIFVEEYESDPNKIINMDKDTILKYLKGLENIDFSKEGEFGRTGSAGSINKIKESIIENLDFLNHPDYRNFEQDLKSENGILQKYKLWFKKNIEKI